MNRFVIVGIISFIGFVSGLGVAIYSSDQEAAQQAAQYEKTCIESGGKAAFNGAYMECLK